MQPLLLCLPYVFTVAGILATLGLFAIVSRRISGLARRLAACETSLQAEAAQLTNALNELRQRSAESQKLEMTGGADLQPAGDLSNAARGKVFKLHRAGQAPAEIAQKLRLSKGEVELLIKAQRLVMRPYENSVVLVGTGPIEKS